MAIRNVIDFNDELFSKVSKPVVKFDERLHKLLDDMRDTLEAVGGYGCAAAHVGVLRRVVVVNDENGVIELVNPVITASKGSQKVFEGSIAPGAPRGYAERPKSVTVAAVDRFGNAFEIEGKGFLAATFCHEIDHLDGVRFSEKFIK